MRSILAFLALAPLPILSLAAALNDTGFTVCETLTKKEWSPACDQTFGPDARFGRDAAARAGKLPKVGGGAAGFDFTKIANDGSVLGPDAQLGDGPKDWACTYDNTTGLLWEVKTTSGLRTFWQRYVWFDSRIMRAKLQDSPYSFCLAQGRCDTESYVADVNAARLCGHHDWRLPSVVELSSIVYHRPPPDDAPMEPRIDATYFPNTLYIPQCFYWSGTPSADDPLYAAKGSARAVDFSTYSMQPDELHARGSTFHVRVVRSDRLEASSAVDGSSPLPNSATAQQSCSLDVMNLTTPDADFVDTGSGTVRHVPTGLMWKRCAETQTWNGQTCIDIPSVASYDRVSARDRVDAVNAGRAGENAGYSDWRLPNINELQSIVEYACASPSINLRQFPNAPSTRFLSSTPSETGVVNVTKGYLDPLLTGVDFRSAGVFNASDWASTSGVLKNIRLVRAGKSFADFDALAPVPAWSPVFRFYNATAGAHFYTLSESERDLLNQHNPLYRYEGVGFYASPAQEAATAPVYRFYNQSVQGHFYTIDQGERDLLISSNPLYKYEGIAFYVSPEARSGMLPVYRFYNATVGKHLYTIGEAEKDFLIQHNQLWQFEGVRFYAAPSP